jgi:hypothetical protein
MAGKESAVDGTHNEKEQWFAHQLTESEFKEFVAEARNSPDNVSIKRAFIGTVEPCASNRVKAVCGKTMTKIMIDNGQIRHAYKKINHNLEDDDIFHIVDVINTATDITVSDDDFMENTALVFQKNIDGNITFLVQVRSRYGGWLAFANCWRKKKKDKAEAAPMLSKDPPEPSS